MLPPCGRKEHSNPRLIIRVAFLSDCLNVNLNAWGGDVYTVVKSLPVSELVHGDRQVCGELLVAGVGVVVVLGQQVHVVEEDTAPVLVSQRLSYPHVQQLGAVECTVPPLDREGGVEKILLEFRA